jgi:hypothetical protein
MFSAFLASASCWVVADQSDTTQQRFDPGEELILTFKSDRYIFGDVFAVTSDNGIFLDFENIIQLLDFPIAENANGNYAGWFINKQNTFDLVNPLPLGQMRVSYKNVPEEPVPANKYLILDGILYVEDSLITEWFGVSFDIDYQLLTLNFTTEDELPFLAKKRREQAYVNKRRNRIAQFPELYRGFGLLSPQIIDFQLNSIYKENTSRGSAGYSLLGSRDIALFNMQFFASGNDSDWLNSARFTARKSDKDALFGVKNLTKISFGDVTPVRQSGGVTSNQSRGIVFENTPLGRDLNYDATSISGPVQVGWDAEVYKNGVLLSQQFNLVNGRFEFNDIPMEAGLNQFKVVLYGPQGQIEEFEETRLLNRDILQSNKLKYRVSLSETGKSLLLGAENNLNDADLGYNFSSNFQKNVLGLLFNAGLNSNFGGDIVNNEVNLSTNFALNNRLLGSTNLVWNDENFRSIGATLRTELLGQRISFGMLNTSQKIESEQGTKEAKDNTSIDLTLSSSFKFGEFGSLSYNNQLLYKDGDFGSSTRVSNGIGLSFPFANFFNTVIYTDGDNVAAATTGNLAAQTSFSQFNLRFNATYDLTDGFDFNATRLDLNYYGWEDVSLRLSLEHELLFNTTSYQLQSRWRNDYMNLISFFRHSEAVGSSAGLSANITFGGAPMQYNSIFKTAIPAASRGTVLVRVFEDTNVNAVYDPGERLIEGATVKSIQSLAFGETDKNGIATLVNLRTNNVTDITVDAETLDDLFLVPLIEGVSVAPREGYVDNIDFPVALGNEIEGLVYSIEGVGAKIGLSKVTVNLFDGRGHLRYSSETEFDGYYYFPGVIAGQYYLSVDQSYLDRQNVKSEAAKWVTVKNDSGLISGIDIQLAQKEYLQGYVPAIASFNSLPLLKLYWKKLSREPHMAPFKKHVFHFTEANQHILALAYFKCKQMAEKVCDAISQKDIDCQVKTHSYEINSKSIPDIKKLP